MGDLGERTRGSFGKFLLSASAGLILFNSLGCATPRYGWQRASIEEKAVDGGKRAKYEYELGIKGNVKEHSLELTAFKKEFKITEAVQKIIPVLKEEEIVANLDELKSNRRSWSLFEILTGGLMLGVGWTALDKTKEKTLGRTAAAIATTGGILVFNDGLISAMIPYSGFLGIGNGLREKTGKTREIPQPGEHEKIVDVKKEFSKDIAANNASIIPKSNYFVFSPETAISDSKGSASFSLSRPYFVYFDKLNARSFNSFNGMSEQELTIVRRRLGEIAKESDIEVTVRDGDKEGKSNIKVSGIVDEQLAQQTVAYVLQLKRKEQAELRGKADTLYLEASKLVESGDYGAAVKTLDDLKTKAPDYQDGSGLRAKIAKGQQEMRSSNEFLAMLSSADDKYGSRNFSEALGLYQNAIRIKPKEQAAMLGAAKSLVSLGRNKEAIAYLNNVITQDDKNADAYYFRGKAYDALGETTNSVADLDKAKSIDAKVAERLRH